MVRAEAKKKPASKQRSFESRQQASVVVQEGGEASSLAKKKLSRKRVELSASNI